MSGVEGESQSVKYSVKELFARIDTKLDSLGAVLDAKADHSAVIALEKRVTAIETGQTYGRGVRAAAWAVVGLLLAIAGLLIPVVLSVI